MVSRHSPGTKSIFEGIRGQLLDATPALGNDQLLDLADLLHEVIRSRRASGEGHYSPGRLTEPDRSWAQAVIPDG